jgi:hypothetical protein
MGAFAESVQQKGIRKRKEETNRRYKKEYEKDYNVRVYPNVPGLSR